MKNIFNEINYNEHHSVDDWSTLTRDVFLKYFSNEELYKSNKELLQTELLNFSSLCSNKDYVTMFNNIHGVFDSAISRNREESFKVLSSNFNNVSNTDDKYLTYFISINTDGFTKKDFATYYFRSIDEIIESCFKARYKLFYKFYKYQTNNIFENIDKKSFGDLVNDNKIVNFELLVKDPIFGIYINQWRNIASHKDFKISSDTIEVKYGSKRDKIQTVTHDELKEVTIWIKNTYGSLRLAEVLINLNYMKDILDVKDDITRDIKQRSEARLLHIVHNLEIVGFKFDSFIEDNMTFELNLFIKNNNDVKESILHASQVFVNIALALEFDEFRKDEFINIRINILNKGKKIVASAIIDIKSCLDFSLKKLSLEELINQINFDNKKIFPTVEVDDV
ncbi:hypothetical protein [Sulfurimonas sp.]|uniref:hypothetical protein n=1 Tax=Sulfurimonas sp. TaxID=2022749 RepID=UPI0035665381